MSWQALMLRLMLRQRCKPVIGTQSTIEDSRAFWAQLFTAPPPPPGVVVRRILAGHVPAEEIEGRRTDRSKVLLYLHGGGFSVGSARPPTCMLERASPMAGTRLIAPAGRPSIRMMRLSPWRTAGRYFCTTIGSR